MHNSTFRRRASIYVMVLGTSLVVSVIGLSALLAIRIKRRTVELTIDFAQARLHAQSAIELGFRRISSDPNWRTTYPNGVWEADRPIGTGTFTLEGTDPDGLPLSNDVMDDLVLTGIGVQGDSRYKLRVTLVAQPQPLTCLEASLHAGNDLSLFAPSTVYGNQVISANNKIAATGAPTVYPDMESVNGFSGTLSPGAQRLLDEPRTMPAPATVFDYYKNNGTWINIANIPIENGVRTIADTVIAPILNPYGAINALGIYVIDCQGEIIQIRDSRIIGTLVLLNTSSGSCVYNSINWEPAVANYPALLVEGKLDLVYTNASLVEAIGVNLNPLGVPYLGEEDTLLDDVYPSRIKGLIYLSGDSGTATDQIPGGYSQSIHVTIDGVMVVGDSYAQTINPSNLDLTYRQTLLDNPPPGFFDPPKMVISPGTWRQVVD